MLVHGGPRVHRDDGLWRWWAVSQGAVRPDRVVVVAPFLDQDLGLAQGVEDLAVEEFIAKPGVETLATPILPRGTRFDEGGLCPDGRDPDPDLFGDELRAIVRPYEFGGSAKDEKIGQGIDDVDGTELAFNPDHERLLGKLVDDVECAEYSAVVGPVLDEIIGPDMVGMFGPQPNAGAIVQPKPALPCLFLRDLKPFPPPDPLDALVIYVPASIVQRMRRLDPIDFAGSPALAWRRVSL